jgi:hypothetical protein
LLVDADRVWGEDATSYGVTVTSVLSAIVQSPACQYTLQVISKAKQPGTTLYSSLPQAEIREDADSFVMGKCGETTQADFPFDPTCGQAPFDKQINVRLEVTVIGDDLAPVLTDTSLNFNLNIENQCDVNEIDFANPITNDIVYTIGTVATP